MLKTLLYRGRSFRHARPFSRWWSNLAFYWHTHDKSELLFFSLLGFPFLGLGLAIYSYFYFYFTAQDHNRELRCLALNVYHEARGESLAGQYAVAEVTMNRVASGAYPNTVCEVVYQKNWDVIRRRYVGAFSWTELDAASPPEPIAWLQAWEAAERVYYGRQTPKLKGVLHYHTDYIRPSWARGKKPVARIGKHLFYK